MEPTREPPPAGSGPMPAHRSPLRSPLAVTLAAVLVPGLLALWAGGETVFGQLWLFAAAILPLLLLLSAVHEGGHLLAGRLVGFRVLACSVGPLRLQAHGPGGRGVRVELNDEWGQAYWGAALSVPVTWDNLGPRAAAMVAGGPLANLLLAGALGGLGRLAPVGSLADLVLHLGAILSLIYFFGNIVPFRSRGSRSDGAWIRLFLTHGPAGERWCAMMALLKLSRGGQRPRDWDEGWIGRLTALDDGSLEDLLASNLAYFWALDRGDVAAATAYHERVLAASRSPELPAAMRPVVFVELAFFEAYFRHDPVAARAYLDQGLVPGSLVERSHQLRAEAAVLLVEGRREEAHSRASVGLAALARSRDSGTARVEREWLQGILAASA